MAPTLQVVPTLQHHSRVVSFGRCPDSLQDFAPGEAAVYLRPPGSGECQLARCEALCPLLEVYKVDINLLLSSSSPAPAPAPSASSARRHRYPHPPLHYHDALNQNGIWSFNPREGSQVPLATPSETILSSKVLRVSGPWFSPELRKPFQSMQ